MRDPNGQILREFVDTNKDNVVDRWSYFKDGIEVYRDVDDNYNGKADNHRWLNMAGTRWGLDKDEDGRIDNWKVISPEEVSAELVMALRDRDQQRFCALLLTDAELKSLGLGADKGKEIATKLEAATRQFAIMMGRQKSVTAKTAWVHFAANKPAMVPAGTDGSKIGSRGLRKRRGHDRHRRKSRSDAGRHDRESGRPVAIDRRAADDRRQRQRPRPDGFHSLSRANSGNRRNGGRPERDGAAADR